MDRYKKSSMVAEHGAAPHRDSGGSDGNPMSTLLPVSTSHRPWRYQVQPRVVYTPGRGMPEPPPLSIGANDASPVSGSALPSTPQGIVTTVADEIVEQAVNSISLPEPVASATTAVIRGALRTCSRRLAAPSPATVPSPAAVDSLVTEDLFNSGNATMIAEEAQAMGQDTSTLDPRDPSWRKQIHLMKRDGISTLEGCMKD